MDELRLIDGKTFPIEEGASLGHIETIAANEAEALTVCEWLTPFNCSHVEFLLDGQPSGIYDDVVIADVPSRTTLEGGAVLVAFGLRQKSDIELRLDTHDEEITELQEAIAEEV